MSSTKSKQAKAIRIAEKFYRRHGDANNPIEAVGVLSKAVFVMLFGQTTLLSDERYRRRKKQMEIIIQKGRSLKTSLTQLKLDLTADFGKVPSQVRDLHRMCDEAFRIDFENIDAFVSYSLSPQRSYVPHDVNLRLNVKKGVEIRPVPVNDINTDARLIFLWQALKLACPKRRGFSQAYRFQTLMRDLKTASPTNIRLLSSEGFKKRLKRVRMRSWVEALDISAAMSGWT